MSCCPKDPEISVGASADSDGVSPSMEMGEGESIECFGRRAGTVTGRLDDKTEPVPDKIENNDIPLVKGHIVNNVKFRLTPNSTAVATSWTCVSEPPLPAGVTFSGDTLNGEFPKETFGTKFKLLVTAVGAEGDINSRSYNFSPAKASRLNDISFVHPMPGSKVTSKFGNRIPPTVGASAFHPGVDFAKPMPADVVAAADGLVIFAANYGTAGNTVMIQHFNESKQELCITKYCHLDSFLVAKNQTVSANQKIGKQGSTGIGTGPHLHFECQLPNTTRIDPLPLIKGPVSVATEVTPDNLPAPDSPIEIETNNGSLTAENVEAKSHCEGFGTPGYPKPKGQDDEPAPEAPPGDPFEKAWFFTMYHEVGPDYWSVNSPNDPDVIAGAVETEVQRKKCGLVTKEGFPGGVTKFGIAKKGNPDLDVMHITYATAKNRGYSGYWKGAPANLVKTKPKTAIMLFDICFLHGPGNGKKMAERANIDQLSDDEAYVELSRVQREFISSLPNADEYGGWYTRNSDLLEYVRGIVI